MDARRGTVTHRATKLEAATSSILTDDANPSRSSMLRCEARMIVCAARRSDEVLQRYWAALSLVCHTAESLFGVC